MLEYYHTQGFDFVIGKCNISLKDLQFLLLHIIPMKMTQKQIQELSVVSSLGNKYKKYILLFISNYIFI